METEAALNTDLASLSSRDTLHEGWRKALPDWAPEPDVRVNRCMREISLLSREYLESSDGTLEEDIRTSSRALAMYLLDGKDQRRWIIAYRDALQHSLLRHVRISPNVVGKVMRFIDVVTDEFWSVYAEQFRLKIRLQQRENFLQELRVAKEIQFRLLPKRIPDIPGFDIAGRLIPADEVGGDYWSCKFYEQDGIVTVKLADIAGHGIAAAMLVSAVKFISGGWYRGADTVATVMEHTNRILVRETPADILVTMFYGWIRPEDRTIDIVNAGHHPVLFCRGDEIREIAPTGPVLGLIQSKFQVETIALEPGDMIYCCSDGVIEARRQEPFGTERLKELIHKHRRLPAGELCDTIIHAVMRFADQPQDDISMIAIKAL